MEADNVLFRGANVASMIVDAIARHPERIAFCNTEATVSYSELGQKISQIAQYLDSLGLKAGDTVAQLGVNRYEVFAVIAAVYLRGMRSVTLHAMGSEQDHEYVLRDCEADVVIVDEYHRDRGEVLRSGCTHIRNWISIGKLPGYVELGQAAAAFSPQPLIAVGDAESIIRLAYTGGTTGQPKGVMLSNRAVATNVVLDLIGKEWPAEVRYLCVAPVSHGAGSLIVPTLMRGGRVTLLREFTAGGVIDAINQHGCNMTWMVPTMLYALLDSGRTREVEWSKFHSLIYSAAPTSPARIRQALDLLGPILVQSYGQTEAPNAVLMLGRSEHARLSDAQLACAGRPYPLLRVALLDETGVEVPDGERGEVCVRGPLVMSGYLNKRAETAETFKGDWLHTGDVAYRGDDGFFYIVDRKKDVVISGGFNVYPKEVEDVICRHPEVATAAVIGVPDAKWGEMVMAYVQLRNGARLSESDILAQVRREKGVVATPKKVQFVDALPLTVLGKIDKKALRALHWEDGRRAVN